MQWTYEDLLLRPQTPKRAVAAEAAAAEPVLISFDEERPSTPEKATTPRVVFALHEDLSAAAKDVLTFPAIDEVFFVDIGAKERVGFDAEQNAPKRQRQLGSFAGSSSSPAASARFAESTSEDVLQSRRESAEDQSDLYGFARDMGLERADASSHNSPADHYIVEGERAELDEDLDDDDEADDDDGPVQTYEDDEDDAEAEEAYTPTTEEQVVLQRVRAEVDKYYDATGVNPPAKLYAQYMKYPLVRTLLVSKGIAVDQEREQLSERTFARIMQQYPDMSGEPEALKKYAASISRSEAILRSIDEYPEEGFSEERQLLASQMKTEEQIRSALASEINAIDHEQKQNSSLWKALFAEEARAEQNRRSAKINSIIARAGAYEYDVKALPRFAPDAEDVRNVYLVKQALNGLAERIESEQMGREERIRNEEEWFRLRQKLREAVVANQNILATQQQNRRTFQEQLEQLREDRKVQNRQIRYLAKEMAAVDAQCSQAAYEAATAQLSEAQEKQRRGEPLTESIEELQRRHTDCANARALYGRLAFEKQDQDQAVLERKRRRGVIERKLTNAKNSIKERERNRGERAQRKSQKELKEERAREKQTLIEEGFGSDEARVAKRFYDLVWETATKINESADWISRNQKEAEVRFATIKKQFNEDQKRLPELERKLEELKDNLSIEEQDAVLVDVQRANSALVESLGDDIKTCETDKKSVDEMVQLLGIAKREIQDSGATGQVVVRLQKYSAQLGAKLNEVEQLQAAVAAKLEDLKGRRRSAEANATNPQYATANMAANANTEYERKSAEVHAIKYRVEKQKRSLEASLNAKTGYAGIQDEVVKEYKKQNEAQGTALNTLRRRARRFLSALRNNAITDDERNNMDLQGDSSSWTEKAKAIATEAWNDYVNGVEFDAVETGTASRDFQVQTGVLLKEIRNTSSAPDSTVSSNATTYRSFAYEIIRYAQLGSKRALHYYKQLRTNIMAIDSESDLSENVIAEGDAVNVQFASIVGSTSPAAEDVKKLLHHWASIPRSHGLRACDMPTKSTLQNFVDSNTTSFEENDIDMKYDPLLNEVTYKTGSGLTARYRSVPWLRTQEGIVPVMDELDVMPQIPRGVTRGTEVVDVSINSREAFVTFVDNTVAEDPEDSIFSVFVQDGKIKPGKTIDEAFLSLPAYKGAMVLSVPDAVVVCRSDFESEFNELKATRDKVRQTLESVEIDYQQLLGATRQELNAPVELQQQLIHRTKEKERLSTDMERLEREIRVFAELGLDETAYWDRVHRTRPTTTTMTMRVDEDVLPYTEDDQNWIDDPAIQKKIKKGFNTFIDAFYRWVPTPNTTKDLEEYMQWMDTLREKKRAHLRFSAASNYATVVVSYPRDGILGLGPPGWERPIAELDGKYGKYTYTDEAWVPRTTGASDQPSISAAPRLPQRLKYNMQLSIAAQTAAEAQGFDYMTVDTAAQQNSQDRQNLSATIDAYINQHMDQNAGERADMVVGPNPRIFARFFPRDTESYEINFDLNELPEEFVKIIHSHIDKESTGELMLSIIYTLTGGNARVKVGACVVGTGTQEQNTEFLQDARVVMQEVLDRLKSQTRNRLTSMDTSSAFMHALQAELDSLGFSDLSAIMPPGAPRAM